MKIEKLTENKIRVIVNSEDLKNNNLDYQTIMEKTNRISKIIFRNAFKSRKRGWILYRRIQTSCRSFFFS